MVGQDQLRGWKEIAAFLATSVRTAKRWEGERNLPVHRQQGGGRDLVSALREDLVLWQRSNRAHAAAEAAGTPRPTSETRGESEADDAISDGASDRAAPSRNRRRVLAAGCTLVVLALAAAAIWIVGRPGRARLAEGSNVPPPSTRSGAAGNAAPISLGFVQLDLSRTDGWKSSVRVADGGAAQIGPSPDHPTLILRPRVVPAGLMLEIARADGRPVKDQGPASQPFVLLLGRNVTVQVRQPFPFSIRWVSAEPPPR